MAKNINGVVVFEKDDPEYENHPAVLALEGVIFPQDTIKWGFQLIESQGKKQIIPLSEENIKS